VTTGSGGSAAQAVGRFARALRVTGGRGGRAGGSESARGGAVRSAQRLGSLLLSGAVAGLDEALRSAGLGDLVGGAGQDVLAGIVDHVSGPGATLEEAVARSAAVWVLCDVLGGEEMSYEDLRDEWESALSVSRVGELIALFLARYIYDRFLSDLAERIESNAVSAREAARIEGEVWRYIRGLVAFDAGEVDLVEVDWAGTGGRALVDRNLRAALELLEARGT